MMAQFWNEESGILTFEWMLLLTVLVIGIIGGLATIRNATNSEAKEVSNAVNALNHSYTVSASVGGTVASTGGIELSATTKSGVQATSFTDN